MTLTKTLSQMKQPTINNNSEYAKKEQEVKKNQLQAFHRSSYFII